MPRSLRTENAEKSYESSFDSAQHLLLTAQQKVSRTAIMLVRSIRGFANERPLQFVGVVAGVSLVAGIALRIWRSKRYA